MESGHMDKYCVYVGDVFLEGDFDDREQAISIGKDYSRNLLPHSRKNGNVNVREYVGGMASRGIIEFDYRDNRFPDCLRN